jgi:tryptophan 2,3-dioxygenase
MLNLCRQLLSILISPKITTRYFFERILRLYEVAVTTMPILMTMRAFAEFRTSIGPTSGFQSFQFRHLEIMSGVQKYWEGETNDADGKPHIAETEFEKRYGADIQSRLERHCHHSLTHYYETLISRGVGDSRPECIAHLQMHPHAAPLLQDFHTYDILQTRRFHRTHLGLAVQQLKLVGADIGTGGTSFRNYLAKYEQELAPLSPGLDGSHIT